MIFLYINNFNYLLITTESVIEFPNIILYFQ